MSTYDDLGDPVSVSRDLLDRRHALLEEARQLISQKREILRELQAARGRRLHNSVASVSNAGGASPRT